MRERVLWHRHTRKNYNNYISDAVRGHCRLCPLPCCHPPRACEKYLSLEHPIQRYEFLAHIRWHNAALHDDLVQTGLLRRRANAIRGGGWNKPKHNIGLARSKVALPLAFLSERLYSCSSNSSSAWGLCHGSL